MGDHTYVKIITYVKSAPFFLGSSTCMQICFMSLFSFIHPHLENPFLYLLFTSFQRLVNKLVGVLFTL
jgi:hypothetical protein